MTWLEPAICKVPNKSHESFRVRTLLGINRHMHVQVLIFMSFAVSFKTHSMLSSKIVVLTKSKMHHNALIILGMLLNRLRYCLHESPPHAGVHTYMLRYHVLCILDDGTLPDLKNELEAIMECTYCAHHMFYLRQCQVLPCLWGSASFNFFDFF